MKDLHEECGVFGIYTPNTSDVVSPTYYALFALQHRGQMSCGIAVNDDGMITYHKDIGLVNDVFTPEILSSLGEGKIAVGHVRYGSSLNYARIDAQPIVISHRLGNMALVHNGCLTNSDALREELELGGSVFHTTGNAELICNTIIRERAKAGSIETAVVNSMKYLKGAFTVVLMSSSKLIAARDPAGIHPLCMGKLGDSVIFASESCAFDSIGAEFVRDVEPGEVIVVGAKGINEIKPEKPASTALCVFEYIYFARPDSFIDGTSVHEARRRAGHYLAKAHPVDADVVVGVPDSGISAAIGYAEESGIPYNMGFIKSKYIARTFIQPTQTEREDKVRIKLNPVRNTVEGKRVVLVDDSIVRGTTSEKIVRRLREAGAKEVHMRISSPPFVNVCYYGTDIGKKEDLIACRMSLDEVAKEIGVDSLGYLEIEDVDKIATECKLGLCKACFTGEYPTEIPAAGEKHKFMVKLSDKTTKK